LFQTPIHELLPSQQLIVIDSQERLPRSFEILIENNIYSAPVYDASQKKYIGFLDLVDVVKFIGNIISETQTNRDILTLVHQESIFASAITGDVVNISNRNAFVPLNDSDTLGDAIRILGSGIHKIPILKNGKLWQVLTQSYIIHFMYKNMSKLGPFVDYPLKDLHLGYPKEVYSVHPTDRAYEAFLLMAKHGVSAVPIIGQHQEIIANISAKDLKLILKEELFNKLYLTAMEFVQNLKSEELMATNPSIVCRPTDLIKTVITSLAFLKIHRLYVVDEKNRPIGVVSLGDILQKIMEVPSK